VAHIGVRLRLARIQSEKTLREVEAETGVSKDTISRVERGLRNPHPLTVAKLARSYGRLAEDLLEDTPVPKAPLSIEELLEQAGVASRWAAMPDEEWEEILEGASQEEAKQLYSEVAGERVATQDVRWPLYQNGTPEERLLQARMLVRYLTREGQASKAANDSQIAAQAEEAAAQELVGAQT
jgi:transcriptional regulator with XRE-family HTH domain